MRQSPNHKRSRGRSSGRKGGGHSANRTFESNGPSAKLRGNASQLFEKYQVLARDAGSAGDRVSSENYLQHAEHYYRLMLAANSSLPRAQSPTGEPAGSGPQPSFGDDSGRHNDERPGEGVAEAPKNDAADSEPIAEAETGGDPENVA